MTRRGILPTLLVVSVFPAWAEDGGAGQALITPKIGVIFWTGLTFIILLFLLKRYAWKPLLGAIEARERSIRESIDNAKRDREEAQGLVQEQRDLLVEARRERAEAVEAGRRDAERLKSEIVAEGRREREQILAQAERQIQAGLRQARSELRVATVDLAMQAAAKLLAKSLDDPTNRKLVEDYLADLERLPAGGSSPPG